MKPGKGKTMKAKRLGYLESLDMKILISEVEKLKGDVQREQDRVRYEQGKIQDIEFKHEKELVTLSKEHSEESKRWRMNDELQEQAISHLNEMLREVEYKKRDSDSEAYIAKMETLDVLKVLKLIIRKEK